MENKEASKQWERPWTTDEIRQQSSNWNLAGDSGLLNHLKQFSQNLLQRTHATEVSLDKLIDDMKTTSTEINNVTNMFLSLANTQFVENRVYDDDEKETPTDEKKEDAVVKSKEQQEAEVVAKVREALALGIAMLDTHFDTVEMPASDSEEDESSASTGRVVLEPHNLYMSRPLPHLIGSKEFMEDDHVGLRELLSDTEDNPDQNMVQSSDSDTDVERDDLAAVPKRPRLSSSSVSENSEPESDWSGTHGKQKKHKVGNSILASGGALEEEGDMFGRESPPEADVGAILQGSGPNRFAAELANKLGGVMAEEKSKKQNSVKAVDNLFSPSLESEEENALFGYQAGKFSDGEGLFDDLGGWNKPSNSLWGDIEHNKIENDNWKEKDRAGKKGDSLFTSDASGDDLFGGEYVNEIGADHIVSDGQVTKQQSAAAKVIRTVANGNYFKQQGIASSTPTQVLPSEKEPFKDLFGKGNDNAQSKNKIETKKADIQRIPRDQSLFDGDDDDDDDLFAALTPSGRNVAHSPMSANTSQEVHKKKESVGGVLVVGDVDLFNNRISPVACQPPFTSSESEAGELRSNILSESSSGLGKTSVDHKETVNAASVDSSQVNTIHSSATAAAKISLLDSEQDEDLLFQPILTSTQKEEISSVFFQEERKSDSLFDKPYDRESREKSGAGKSLALSNQEVKSKKPVSLFDDSDSGDDELLFSSTSSTSSRSRRSQGSGDLLATDKKPLQKKQLFDNDDILFEGLQQDDPGFDIFYGENSHKRNAESGIPKIVPDEKYDSLFGDNVSNMKRSTVELFNDDDVDDIFNIPLKPKETLPDTIKTTLKSTYSEGNFSENDTDDIGDIFSPGISKLSGTSSQNTSNLFTASLFQDEVDDIFGSPKDINHPALSNTFTTNGDSSTSLFEKSVASDTSVKETNSESEVEHKVLDNKPLPISQKPKVLPRKPPPRPSERKKLPSVSLKSDVMQGSSESKENLKSGEEQRKEVENISSGTTERGAHGQATQREASESSEVLILPVDSLQGGNGVQGDLQGSSELKPEPPRTLNIRKTTEVLFGSSSNEDDDLFGSSWTGKSSGEKVTSETTVNQIEVCGNVLSSSTLNALLDDYSSVSEKPPLAKDVEVNNITTASLSTEKRSESEKEISHRTEHNIEAVVKAKSLEPIPTMRSPCKIQIDPTALLPGAKPPSKIMQSEIGVGFDQPADANATLYSAAKERAKIQVKRRLPSRRARQEALRASSMDQDMTDDTPTSLSSQQKVEKERTVEETHDKVNIDGNDDARIVSPPKKPALPSKPTLIKESTKKLLKVDSNVISTASEFSEQKSPEELGFPAKLTSKLPLSDQADGNSNPLSPSTDEEDIFAVPQDLPSEYGSNKDHSTDDSKNLFGGAPLLSPVDLKPRTDMYGSTQVCSGSLFPDMVQNGDYIEDLTKDSTDSPDNLFPSDMSLGNTVLCPKSGWKGEDPLVREPVEEKRILKRESESQSGSLDDDSDDLFGSNKSARQYDLFSTIKKETIAKHKDVTDIVNLPSEDDHILFSSKGQIEKKEEADLFSSPNEVDLFYSEKTKQGDPEKIQKRNQAEEIEEISRDKLFSVDNDSNLFSVKKPGLNREPSDLGDLFPADVSKLDNDDDDSIFSSGIEEHRNLQCTEKEDAYIVPDHVRDSKSDKAHLFITSNIKENEDDLFSKKGKENIFPSGSKPDGGNLFGEESVESDDLFASSLMSGRKKPASVMNDNTSSVSKSNVTGQHSLFDDDGGDDFIFGASSANVGPRTTATNEKYTSEESHDEADDLFSNTGGLKKNSKPQLPLVYAKEDKEEDLFEDPLMVIKK